MSNFSKKIITVVMIVVFLYYSDIIFAEGESFGVYTSNGSASGGGVAFNFYPSGYSDGFWWGETTRHSDYGYHAWYP